MLIKNGKILTMAGVTYDNGYICVEDGKIKEIGEVKEQESEIEKREQDKKERVIDVHGAWVMPGMIDAHSHVGIVEEKWGIIGDDCNEMTSPMTPHIRAIDAVNPMDPAFHDAILGGITSLMTGPGSSNVVGGQSMFLKVQGRNVERMVVKSPAAMKVAFGENPKMNYGQKDKMPGSRMAVAAMLREEIYRACQYQEKKEKGNLETKELDFRMESWLPVLRGEIPLKAHAHRADDILTAIRIAKEFHLNMTLDHCSEGHLIAEEIALSGYPAIVGPDLSSRSKIEIKNMSFKTAGVLERAGVKTAIMTDHPVSLIRYLPLYAGLCVKQGMSLEGAFKAITIHAAQICGVSDRVGSLEIGKDADIVVFNGNPMETFTKTLLTIVDGIPVYEDFSDD